MELQNPERLNQNQTFFTLISFQDRSSSLFKYIFELENFESIIL